MNVTANIKSTLIQYASALRGEEYDEDELEDVQKSGGLDVEDLLGKACRVTIVHEAKGDKIKDKIKTVSPLDPEDDVAPEVDGDETYWDWEQGIDCPKRIAYFWNRATENPNAEWVNVPGSASQTTGPITPGHVVDIDSDDIPF